MKNRVLVVVLLLAAISGLSAAEKGDAKKSIKAMNDKIVQAINARNIDGIMAAYWNNADLVSVVPDGEHKGYDKVRDSWSKNFDIFDSLEVNITESHPTMIGNNAAYDWGHYTWNARTKDSPMMKIEGRYMRIWAMKSGKWVVVAEEASNIPPKGVSSQAGK